jgi:hypothetical protein
MIFTSLRKTYENTRENAERKLPKLPALPKLVIGKPNPGDH